MTQALNLRPTLYRIGLALCGWAVLFQSSAAFAQDAGWSLEPSARIETGAISAQTDTRDEAIVIDGDGLLLRGQIGAELTDRNTRIGVQADLLQVWRLDDDRDDYNRDRFTAYIEQDIDDDWEIQLRGRYTDDVITVESGDTDELQASARVEYEPERAHRFRARATWREREYDNGPDPQTEGSGPRFDAQYRHRMGRYHYITFDLRAESISSNDPERGFERQSAKVSYTQPITPDLRVRPAINLIRTQFDGRLTLDGERRDDFLVAPEVKLMYWPGNWRAEAQAKYILGDSNLSTREREGYRLTLSIGYVF